jgi:myosin tail region-interacting protein MTI1
MRQAIGWLAVSLLAGPCFGQMGPEKDESAEIRQKVVAFCKERLGKQVGDGECGTLAAEALAAAGAKSVHDFKQAPGPGDFVWGEPVFVLEVRDGKRTREPAKAAAKPGDIIQYRDAVLRTASGGLFLASHHTAVVIEAKSNGDLVVLEQNINGKKQVARSTLRPNGLTAGWLRVYRPVPK